MKSFGPKATNALFRKSRFGKFLLLLAQMKLLAHRWKLDMYLQANMSSEAIEFYKKVGFRKMPTNTIKELPKDWRTKVNDATEPNFYLKFVTDDVNRMELEDCNEITGVMGDRLEFLHLYCVVGQIQTVQFSRTVN